MASRRRTDGVEIAIDLYELAVELLRQRLRRVHPRRARAAIEAEIDRWRLARPGAEHGDAPGRVLKHRGAARR